MSLLSPSYGWRRIVRIPTRRAGGEGAMLRRRAQDRAQVLYEIRWAPGCLDGTDFGALVAQWVAAGGGGNYFSYTPPDESSPVQVRFLNPDLELDVESINATGGTVLLEKKIPAL